MNKFTLYRVQRHRTRALDILKRAKYVRDSHLHAGELARMNIKLEVGRSEGASAIAALRCAVSEDLTVKFGQGSWSGCVTERGVLWAMRQGEVYVVRRRGGLMATLTLSTRKPWAIDRKYFTASRHPIYLTSMAVSPTFQRQGIGRRCVDKAREIVKQWPGDAIRLDAYDWAVGAGEFYRKCGFREVGRASYRNVPLIYFEMLL